jgi:hypothetical protein
MPQPKGFYGMQKNKNKNKNKNYSGHDSKSRL